MPRMEFEAAISLFERAKTFRVSNLAATVHYEPGLNMIIKLCENCLY
jgi:hypothetical protein